jgi:anti-sigma factor (TIGR02949 family)
MTCREAIEKLVEYLDVELSPAGRAEFEAHLAICAACRSYVATYAKTRDLVAKINRVDIPDTLKSRLRELLST